MFRSKEFYLAAWLLTATLLMYMSNRELHVTAPEEDVISHQDLHCQYGPNEVSIALRQHQTSITLISALDKCKAYMEAPVFKRGDVVAYIHNGNCKAVIEEVAYDLKKQEGGYQVYEKCGYLGPRSTFQKETDLTVDISQ